MAFVYGRPVRLNEFLGRESEILTIFNRLKNRESTAVVGEPHIGKTSLLLRIQERSIQEYFLKDEIKIIGSFYKDLQPIGMDFSSAEFWEETLEPLQDLQGQETISSLLNQAEKEHFSYKSLRRLFQQISESGQVLLLLLDEFDHLLSHPKFKDPTFFAGLRSLSTTTGGLVIVTSSRLSLSELNKRGHELLGGNTETSPFFNNLIEIKLRPFSHDTANLLIQNTPNEFSPQEISFIRRVAGRHPYLIQAMAATLLEMPKGESGQLQAAEYFYDRISSHFDTLWNALSERSKTTSVILSLMDLEGYSSGSSFSYGEIENVEAFDIELRNLADLGLAEKIYDGWKIDARHGLIWRGEQWTVGAQAFTWWVRDVVISNSRRLQGYDEWLKNKRYTFLLTEGQWNNLLSIAKSTPDFFTKGISSLARKIIQEIAGII